MILIRLYQETLDENTDKKNNWNKGWSKNKYFNIEPGDILIPFKWEKHRYKIIC